MGFCRKNWLMILILALGLALRLVVLFTEGDRMFLGTDDENYVQSAEILLRTGMLSYGHWPGPTVFIMPGYPLLLGLVFIIAGGTSWLAARLMQVAVSMAALWLSIRLGARIGGRGVGLLTGLILAVYPPNLTAPDFLLTETVFTFSLLLALYWFMLAAETRRIGWFTVTGAAGVHGRTGWYAMTGLALGLGTYFRPTAGLLPVVFFVYLLLRGDGWRRALHGAGVMGVVLVLLLTPWMVRNYVQFKEVIPFTVSSGNPFLRGTYINNDIIVRNNSERFPWVKDSHILSDRAQMEFGRQRLKAGFRQDFWGYLRWYTIGKFVDYWGGPYYYKPLSYLPAKPVQVFHNILLAVGAGGLLLGLLLRKPPVLLLLLVCGYFTLIHMVYLTGPRYGFPTMQLAAVLAAYGLVEGGRALMGKNHVRGWGHEG